MPAARPRRSAFYLAMAIAFVIVAVAGFSTTLFLPLARGEFQAPPVVWLHGMLMFAWVLVFLTQSLLVRSRRIALHRTVGWIGAGVAAAIVGTGFPLAFHVTHRDLAAGQGDSARGQLPNLLIEMLVFGGLVLAAVLQRRRPETHKRLVLLATISALGPAWIRFRHFLPWVPEPLIVFSLVAVAHDLATRRRVHPVYLFVGGGMVAVHMAELFSSQTAPWLRVARALLGEAPG